MHRDHALNLMTDLHLTQLCLSQIAHISTSRLSRFLGGSLELNSEEALRLSQALCACWTIQNGPERLAENLPINWDECADEVKQKIAADPNAVREGWNDFAGDVEFFPSEECAALTLAIPHSALIELMESSNKFIKIGRGEFLNLLKIKIENPETSVLTREASKKLLSYVPGLEGPDAESMKEILAS
jgi:hypothetical protein